MLKTFFTYAMGLMFRALTAIYVGARILPKVGNLLSEAGVPFGAIYPLSLTVASLAGCGTYKLLGQESQEIKTTGNTPHIFGEEHE